MKLFQKISNKKSLIVIILTAIFFVVSISYFEIETSDQTKTVNLENKTIVLPVEIEQTTLIAEANTKKQKTLVSGIPVNIKIPKIEINAVVENMGLTLEGAVDAPLGPDNVGWWKEGPIPGATGNAIIDGHSGWKNNIPAVFDNLKNLNKGDKIYITSSTGVITTFVVNELKTYGKNDTALDVFTSTDNKSHLNLITCTGIWDNLVKGRDSRLVVFADKE